MDNAVRAGKSQADCEKDSIIEDSNSINEDSSSTSSDDFTRVEWDTGSPKKSTKVPRRR